MTGTLFDAEDEVAERPRITTLAPWFGSNRMLASEVGKELRGLKWVGVPFAGGMTELAHIQSATIVANDLHRHVINLARVIAHPVLGPKLYRQLKRKPFHPDELADAQAAAGALEPVSDAPNLAAAEAYFASVWMGRSARAGQASELTGKPCIRWTGNGGSSATRYRSAVGSLKAWRAIVSRCDFTVLDALEFVGKVKDEEKHGVYCDPPFPGPGDSYRHKFGEARQRELAAALSKFQKCRVVCRFYDHPLIRELYPEGDRWTWRKLVGRDQSNNDEKPEVLILNGPSLAPAN